MDNRKRDFTILDLYIEAIGIDKALQVSEEEMDATLFTMTCYPFGEKKEWIKDLAVYFRSRSSVG